MKRYDLTIGQAAKLYGVSYGAIWQRVHCGKIPHARVGRSYRLNADDLERFFVQKED